MPSPWSPAEWAAIQARRWLRHASAVPDFEAAQFPELLAAIKHLFDHRCYAGGKVPPEDCPHISPEERALIDAWVAGKWPPPDP